MFFFQKDKIEYDENNPCDYVISRLIGEGEYIGTADSYEFIQCNNKIFMIGATFPLGEPFSVCEVSDKDGFNICNIQNSEWITLWIGSTPSKYATKRFAKFLNYSRIKLWGNMLGGS